MEVINLRWTACTHVPRFSKVHFTAISLIQNYDISTYFVEPKEREKDFRFYEKKKGEKRETASSFYAISTYKMVYRNTLFVDSGGNLHLGFPVSTEVSVCSGGEFLEIE